MNDSKLLKEVNYKGEDMYLHLSYYMDGKQALILCPSDELINSPENYVLTSNIEGTNNHEMAINDHDYHKGNLKFLCTELKDCFKHVGYKRSGFVDFPIILLIEPFDD